MKNIIVMLLFLSISCTKKEAQTLDYSTDNQVEEKQSDSNSTLIGNWKVYKVEGDVMINIEGVQKTKLPMDIWIDKEFRFGADGQVELMNGETSWVKSKYEVNGNQLKIFNLNSTSTNQFEINKNEMKLIQPNENFIQMMAKQTNLGEDQIRTLYEFPKEVIFYLKKI